MDLNTALKILQIDDNYSSLTKEKLKNNYKKLSMIKNMISCPQKK